MVLEDVLCEQGASRGANPATAAGAREPGGADVRPKPLRRVLGLGVQVALVAPLLPEQRQCMRRVDDERSLRRADAVVQRHVQGHCYHSRRGPKRICSQSLAGLGGGEP